MKSNPAALLFHEVGQPLQMLFAQFRMLRIDISQNDQVEQSKQLVASCRQRIDRRPILLRMVGISIEHSAEISIDLLPCTVSDSRSSVDFRNRYS